MNLIYLILNHIASVIFDYFSRIANISHAILSRCFMQAKVIKLLQWFMLCSIVKVL